MAECGDAGDMRAFGYFVLALLILLAIAALASWAFGWSIADGDARGAQLAWGGTLAALMSVGILASSRQKASTTIFSLLAWAGAFLLLILAYSYRDDAKALWGRIRGEFFGSEPVVTTAGDVELRRSTDAHFYAEAQVNGGTVSFMVDTGASMVALSWTDARAAGINPQSLDFSQTVITAGGPVKAARIRIGRLAIGPIVRRDVDAGVLPEGVEGSLLGLSFLDTLSSYEISGDRLTLRD